MAQTTREEDRPSEDEIVLKKLGPQGVPGAPDTAKMTPQVEKQMPRFGDFDGHTAWLASTPQERGSSALQHLGQPFDGPHVLSHAARFQWSNTQREDF
jgi:hypothetical protein